MNTQNNFIPNNNPYYGGQPFVQYGAPVQAPKMTQVLTPEQQNSLRDKGFDLRVTEEDILRAVCTHKSNGNIVLMDLGNGRMRCPICGEEFNLAEVDPENVKEATDVILDFLQSTKTMYLDIPEETAANYFKMIPLLKKLPELYKLAVDNFNKFFGSGATSYGMQRNNGFNMLNNMFSPMAVTGGSYYQQPMMNGYAAPGMTPQQQPMMNGYAAPGMMSQQAPVMAAPMMGANPFGYNAPAMGGMPQQQPMMNPQVPNVPAQPAAPATPVAPAAPSTPAPEVTQQKTMNV